MKQSNKRRYKEPHKLYRTVEIHEVFTNNLLYYLFINNFGLTQYVGRYFKFLYMYGYLSAKY